MSSDYALRTSKQLVNDIQAAKQLQSFLDHFQSFQDVCSEEERIEICSNQGPVVHLCEFVEKTEADVHFWNAFGMCREDFMIKVSSLVAGFSPQARDEMFMHGHGTPFGCFVNYWAKELWNRNLRKDGTAHA
jgi:hypothetical protein